MILEPVETLQQLVRIPSVNPLGRASASELCGERRLTDYLQSLCEAMGLASWRQEVHPGRENLLAVVPGNPSARDGGELLLWDVHQDTVSVDGMTIEPFGCELRDSRVYGRGASDVKGTMAAMLAAISRRVEAKPTHCPTIVVAFTVNEECGFTGSQALARMWQENGGGDALVRRPDAAIVAEPTDLNVVVAHQGMVRWRCHAEGRAAHSSRPDEGVNAIYAISRVVRAIEEYHAELCASADVHPLCGRPSVCVTTIHGGVGINTVPDRVTIEIDRRLRPGQDPSAAYESLVRYLADRAESDESRLVHDPPFMQSAGLSGTSNGPMAERLAEIVRAGGRACAHVGAAYGTDAAPLAAAGIPTVVFGAGSIRQAHTADEFIEVEELRAGAEVYYQIARRGLTGN